MLAAQFQFGFLQLISRSIPEINEAKIEMKPAAMNYVGFDWSIISNNPYSPKVVAACTKIEVVWCEKLKGA